MQGYFKMNNNIFDYALTPNEYSVLAYLYSCADKRTYIAKAKQTKIAAKCGLKQAETVSRIISSLKQKGLINDAERRLKRNLVYGTYRYKLQPVRSNSFFCVPRLVIGLLNAVQMRMYLFVCKCVTKAKTMWNSYNDISRSLGIRRDKAIAAIKELVGKGLLKKKTVLKSDGSYSDNHYELSTPNNESEENEQKEEATRTSTFGWQTQQLISSSWFYYKSCGETCQAVMRKNSALPLFLSGVVP